MILASTVLPILATVCIVISAAESLSVDNALSYEMTPEEIKAFVSIKKQKDPSYEPLMAPVFRPESNPDPFGQAEYPLGHTAAKRYLSTGNTGQDCVSHNGEGLFKVFYKYSWDSAYCHRHGVSPDFTLNCSTTFRIPDRYETTYKGRNSIFWHACKPPGVCMDLDLTRYLNGYFQGFSFQDVYCVDPRKIVLKEHHAVAFKDLYGHGSGPEWCLQEHVPGFNYPPMSRMTPFVLTEEVSWANGSTYKAPKLYIRDNPKYIKNGFDHAYKTNTDVISTEIEIGSVRNRLQSKAVEFCMEMIRGGDVWTVMMYTWFRTTSRSGKPEEAQEMKPESQPLV